MRSFRSINSLAVLALAFSCLTPVAQAQPRGGQTGGGAGNTGGGGGGLGGGNVGRTPTPNTPTPNIPNNNNNPNSRQQQPGGAQLPRPMFLSGKVMLDDGTPPPETVLIERLCGASHRPEGYTDTKGRFSFQLGQGRGMLPDASVGATDMDPMSNGMGGGRSYGSTTSGARNTDLGGTMGTDPRLMGCELRAVLAGFRSETVTLANRRVMDNPDVGTIILHRLANVDGTTISATSLAAPKDAKKAYDKGLDAVKKEKWADAQKNFEKAVEAYPKYAAAWYELGEVQQRQNNNAEALKSFRQSMGSDPKYLKPYLPAAMLLVNEKQWQEAADLTDKLTRLDPVDYPGALMYNAIANVNLHKMDVAEKSAREAVKLDTDHRVPRAQYVLGFILANRQQYPEALAQMKSYIELSPDAPDVGAVRKQIADLEKASGQPGAPAEAPKQQ